jgi:PAS domain S-box-containing protein
MKIYLKTGIVLLLLVLLQSAASVIVHQVTAPVDPAGPWPPDPGTASPLPGYGGAWITETAIWLILGAALMLYFSRTLISPLKRSRERERYYRSLLFGMSDEVIVLDADYRITDMNREKFACAPVDRKGAIGRHPDEVFDGGSVAFKNSRTEEMAGAVFRTGKPHRCRQHVDGADGREVWKDLRISPLTDDNGQVSRAILTVRDVTREVKLEEQLRQSQKLEAIGALAGGIAHDFNNLLMSILLNIEYVMARCDKGSAEGESLEMALAAGRHAADLVDQILTFSRKHHTAKRPLVLAPLVKEILKMLRSSLPATIEIRQEIDETTDKMVQADPSQIQQILVNLCTNAAEAMKGGPGIISVSLAEHHPAPDDPLPDAGRRRRPYLRLTVEDNGAGIPNAVRDNIFDPFFTTRPCQAAGMGLSMAHGAVKGMEGAILVDSAPEKGSRFDILLPCCETEEGEPETMAALNGFSGRADGHILVVDDDNTVVQILTKTLSEVGYETTGVAGGAEALERFHQSPDAYDMLITDLTMPGMTGIDLTRQIRAVRPDLPVVMTTGYGEVLPPQEARKMGIRELMAKPVSGTRLLAVTRRILEGKK